VDSNTLEQSSSAPTKVKFRSRTVCGFAAVAAGIWLAVLIFRAIASGALHLF